MISNNKTIANLNNTHPYDIAAYESPLGKIFLAATKQNLIGCWFQGQKYFNQPKTYSCLTKSNAVLDDAKRWLDIYFMGQNPQFSLPLYFCGTHFQKDVWQILCAIPYGQTTTYAAIARLLAQKTGQHKIAAQAVGHAVGRNNIAIIVPCHRVIGATGKLTGYAGGLDKKEALLKLENA